MGQILIEALLCGLPIMLLFLSLYQITSWKASSFRWGIVILEFSDPLPMKIPKQLTGRIIEYKGITFKFVSQKLGLFQSTVFNRRPASEDYPLVSSIFPLLGEVVLDEAGIAKIITRIPNSIVLLIICSLITFFGFTFLSNGVKAEPAFAIGGILFIIVSFFMERSGVHVRFQKIKEYILENT